ncbi:MAG: DNA gyrase subunit A [Candidatus Omnitrophica bacterium]|nr:DNA gyrase subunit A [Candidatus Omnitrophota bacterium]
MRELHLEHNKPYKKSARIVGECFVKDTLVLTDKGLLPIQSVNNGDVVYTQRGTKKVRELYIMPPRPIMRISLEHGVYNDVTESQKFKVLNKDFTFTWKEAKDLTSDDYIILKASYPTITRKLKLKKIHPLNPSRLNENIAYLLGIFISEGWISKNQSRKDTYKIGIAANSRSIIGKIADILMEEFDYLPTIEERPYYVGKPDGARDKKCTYMFRISKGYITKFFIENFNLAGMKAETKSIPMQILLSPQSVIYAFISGLIDGDGSLQNKRAVIQYGSISLKLINQLQIALQHLGIFGTRYTEYAPRIGEINGKKVSGKKTFYSLEFNSVNTLILASRLSLADSNKEMRRKEICAQRIGKSSHDIIPFAGSNVFGELSERHLGGGWYSDSYGEKFRTGIKYSTGCKICYRRGLRGLPLRKSQVVEWGLLEKLGKIKSPLYEFMNHVVSNDIFFMKVLSVDKRPSQITYDIQVEGDHEFIANGMIAHNCLGKYHPHGDMAVYDALARMVQDFSLRYPLVDGQGNFGSIDGDAVAAMRYTEARMASITDWMLADIEKETVKFTPNFDDSLQEPLVLPATLPNLLINGSSGIAVGMATNMPPHNLSEVVDGIIAAIDDPDIEIKDLMKYIKGPDFPTGGIICGKEGIASAYKTGRGRVIVHAKAATEELKGGKQLIVITEIPYQVNKTNLIESIANLVQSKRVEGISDLRDESDKDGMRIVIELRRDQDAQVVLNQLYKHTQMQTTFGIIMLALVNNRPEVLNLKQIIRHYINHRKEIIINRTKFDLARAEERAHILEGLKIAIKNLDKIVNLIKRSKDPKAAKIALMDKFELSDRQAQAILEMQLQRLTGLERDKIDKEYLELLKRIEYLKSILASEKKVLELIKNELLDIKKKYGDDRRTALLGKFQELEMEDLIAEEDVVITISHSGYIKRFPVSSYRKQKRGGKGVTGAGMKEEDFIQDIFVESTHSNTLFFTNKGKAHLLKVYDIPQAGRLSKGKSVVNLLRLAQGEDIASSIAVKEFDEGLHLVMVTKMGKIKKTSLTEFANIRRGGINAINIGKGDALIRTQLASDRDEIFIATREGKAIHFPEKSIRIMGRNAAGVRGINLGKKDEVVSMAVVKDKKATLLTVTKNGFGKRTEVSEYRIQSRGGKGIINIKVTSKNGPVVGLKMVSDSDDIMLVTQQGMVVRCSVKDIRATGRAAQGVRIIKLDSKDSVASIASVIKEEEEEE